MKNLLEIDCLSDNFVKLIDKKNLKRQQAGSTDSKYTSLSTVIWKKLRRSKYTILQN